jgi:bifunctional DNA-binding transcriptional regulator/antitoxin component of YhaV-PrlF toxin-antitoxin module
VPVVQRLTDAYQADSLTVVRSAKPRWARGWTRISARNQATIPVNILRQAGLRPGDKLRVEAAGRGRIVLARADEAVAQHAGSLTGVYRPGYLKALRREGRR